MSRCNLYIIGHKHDVFDHALKIGISANVADRLAQFQTGCVERLDIYFAFSLPDRTTAPLAEAAFHELFDDSCVRGEWFGMSPDRAIFMATLVVINVLRSRFSGADLREERARAGLHRAFALTDQIPSNFQTEFCDDWARRVAS